MSQTKPLNKQTSAKKAQPIIKPVMEVRRTKPKVKPKIPPMDQKIKPNPKYQKVQPVTDTGNNMRKQIEKMEELRQYYRFRPDEIFRRITITSMVNLMVEVSKLEYQEEDLTMNKSSESPEDSKSPLIEEANPSVEAENETSREEVDRKTSSASSEEAHSYIESVVFKGKMIKRSMSQQSQLQSSIGDLLQGGSTQNSMFRPHNQQVASSRSYHHQNSFNAASAFNHEESIAGSGSGSRKTSASDYYAESVVSLTSSASSMISCRPFLILDIREPEDFERAHIVMAKNFPSNRLTRAVNFETKEMLNYKNKEGKLIIVYDYDESLSHKVATTLVQRGYDNVFMLSGGIRLGRLKFPECLIRMSDQRKDSYEDERLSEHNISVLEAFLEEHSGSSRIYSSTGRLNSLANLPYMSKRGLLHSPIRMPNRSSSIGRS